MDAHVMDKFVTFFLGMAAVVMIVAIFQVRGCIERKNVAQECARHGEFDYFASSYICHSKEAKGERT